MIQTSQRETLESLISLISELQNKTWHHENLDKDQTLTKLIKLAQELGLKTGPEESTFLSDLLDRLIKEYFKSPEQQPASIPPNIAELVEIYDKAEQEKEDRLQRSIASQEELKKYQSFVDHFKKVITANTTKELPPKLIEQMAENAANKTIASLPVVAQSEFFPEEDKKQITGKIEEALQNELKKVGEELKIGKTPDEEKTTKEDKKIIEAEAIKIAAEPQIIEAIKEIKFKEIPPLPEEVLVKLKQATETIYPLPAYILLNPKADTKFFIEKTANTASARLIELAVKNAPSEWLASKNWPIIQETVERRIFWEKLQQNVNFFKEIGVPTNHPLIQQFEDKITELLKVQKNPKTGQDYRWVKILKNDSLAWPRMSNRFSFIFKTKERFNKFFSEKITQPIVKWLAKTAVGKAAQQGIKKAAVWITAKLGMKLGIEAGIAVAGGVSGPPGWVVAAVTIGLDILKTLGRKIFGFVRRIIQEPDKAFGSAGIGVLLLVFAPMPFALIGIIPLVLGGSGLISFTLAPATLGAIGGGVGAFFTALSTLPFILPIVAFVVTLLSVVAGLTFLIVMIVGGAFVLPQKVSETTPTTISPYESEYFEIKKTVKPVVKMLNSDLPLIKEITYQVSIRSKGKILKIESIEDSTLIIKKSGTSSLTPHSFSESLKNGDEIAAGDTWQVEYTLPLQSSFEDSMIVNNLSFWLIVEGESGGRFPGTASAVVIIGNPPTDCFVLDGYWSPEKTARMLHIITTEIQAHPYFFSKVCSRGPIKIVNEKAPSNGKSYSGFNPYPGGKITLYDLSFNKRESTTTYTFIHELGHELDYITNGSLLADFVRQVLCQTGENNNCEHMTTWYRFGIVPSEDFAETTATYSFGPTYRNFQRDYPLHYNYAKNIIFNE